MGPGRRSAARRDRGARAESGGCHLGFSQWPRHAGAGRHRRAPRGARCIVGCGDVCIRTCRCALRAHWRASDVYPHAQCAYPCEPPIEHSLIYCCDTQSRPYRRHAPYAGGARRRRPPRPALRDSRSARMARAAALVAASPPLRPPLTRPSPRASPRYDACVATLARCVPFATARLTATTPTLTVCLRTRPTARVNVTTNANLSAACAHPTFTATLIQPSSHVLLRVRPQPGLPVGRGCCQVPGLRLSAECARCVLSNATIQRLLLPLQARPARVDASPSAWTVRSTALERFAVLFA